MKKLGLVITLFFVCAVSFATPPVYGPLQAQNNLDDVDNAATSLFNIGGAPIASPTFTGTVTIPSGSVLNTPASINLTNATGIPYSGLPALAANQLLGSLTATTPSGQSVPSCSATTDALLWTSGTGFSCNTSINAGTLGGATFASPGSIGNTTAASGKFTTLQATSTVTGIGLIGVQTFCSSGCTSTGGTYTPDTGTQLVIVEDQAPGGGGGGAGATSSGQSASGGGGGAGSYAEALVTSSFSGVTVTSPAGGSGASAGNNAGTAGSTASFGSIISCPGGNAGSGGAAGSVDEFVGSAGASSACTVSGATLLKNISGGQGPYGLIFVAGSASASGAGGNSALSSGGASRIGSNSGTSGNGYGSGGGGGNQPSASSSAEAGGNGSQSIIIVYEYN